VKTSPRRTAGSVKRLPRGRDRCAGCHSEQRAQLDADIVARVPFRVLAERYGISSTAIFRHRKHVAVSLVRVEAPFEATMNGSASDVGVDVVLEARRLFQDTRAALDSAVQQGNMLGLSLAAREVHRSLELLGRQLERIESRRGALVVDVATLPSFIAMRTKILRALAPFPAARLAVAAVLDADEADA
jgi:hypothetical protein